MLNVILDLDETLINTHTVKRFTPRHFRRARLFKWKRMGKKYIVIARPGLDRFLGWLFRHFKVSVWTAASRSYAMFVVKHFIATNPDRIPIHIFSSNHCKSSMKKGKSHKDLRFLYQNFPKIYNKSNTIIVDDREDVCVPQAENSYNIKPFLFLQKASYRDNKLIRLSRFLAKHSQRAKLL